MLLVQFAITLALSLMGLIFFNFIMFKSALLGGITVIIPTIFFIMIFFKQTGAQNSRQIAKNFYLAEVVKLILAVILFAIVFIFCKIAPLMFFLTFILVQSITWFLPLLINR